MKRGSSTPLISTFIVRFWREWSAGRPRWRGRIEHLQSGKSTAFLDLGKMLGFIRRLGIMREEEEYATNSEEIKS